MSGLEKKKGKGKEKKVPSVVSEDIRGIRVVAELPRVGRCHR